MTTCGPSSHFERAIQIDPSYAAAHAGLSHGVAEVGNSSGGGAEGVLNRRHVRRPQRLWSWMTGSLKPMSPRAFSSFSVTGIGKGGELNQAGSRTGSQQSGCPLQLYGGLLMALGTYFQEAIREIQTAEQLDPLSHQVQVHFGRIALPSWETR